MLRHVPRTVRICTKRCILKRLPNSINTRIKRTTFFHQKANLSYFRLNHYNSNNSIHNNTNRNCNNNINNKNINNSRFFSYKRNNNNNNNNNNNYLQHRLTQTQLPTQIHASLTLLNNNKYNRNSYNSYHNTVNKRYFTTDTSNAASNTQQNPGDDKILFREIEQDAAKALMEVTFKQIIDYSKLQSTKLKKDDSQQQKKIQYNNRTVLLESAEWIRQQLPGRLAKIILGLKNLPYGILDTPSFEDVFLMYINTYRITKTIPEVKTLEDETRFVKIIRFFLKSHLMTIPKMCCGLLEKTVETKGLFNMEDTPYLGDFLDDLALQRLSIRILLGHQLTLHDSAYDNTANNPNNTVTDSSNNTANNTDVNTNNNGNKQSGFDLTPIESASNLLSGNKFHGIFEENCDFSIYINKGINDAIEVCESYYNGISPNVNVIDKRQMFECTYVPETLHHMIFELLKNSIRATVEHSLNKQGYTVSELNNEAGSLDIRDKMLNDIKSNKFDINLILVDDINGDVTIKVEDKGGGISKSELEKIFLYGYTTAYRGDAEASSTMIHRDDENEQDVSESGQIGVAQSGQNSANNTHNSDEKSGLSGLMSGLESSESAVDSEEIIRQFELRSDLTRQKELYSTILFESEQELDADWQFLDSINDKNFMKFVEDEKYTKVGRSILGALKSAPMNGLGYGLPVVRVYSKYFGGSCKVYSVHGYGTDVYLRCPNLSQLQDFKV